MAGRVILWTVQDPRGLSISLVEDVRQGILQKHSEMDEYFDQVRLTAQDPDEIYFDPEVTTKRLTGTRAYLYYKRAVTGSIYSREMVAVAIKVVIESGGEHGYVSTAFFTHHIPKRLVLEWEK